MNVRQLGFLKQVLEDREMVSAMGVAAVTFGVLVAAVALVADILRPVMYVADRGLDIARVGVLGLSIGLIVVGTVVLRRGRSERREVEA